MPTCLVTGGAGFLGSHLCDHLLGAGHRVICVDNVETGSLRNIAHIRDELFRFLQHDITSHFDIDEPVDFVYHMASPASPIDYARLPLHTLKVGAYGTHNALGLAKAKRARFLLASTSEVYGDPLVHPQPETYWGNVNPIGPRGVYDEAKRYAEALTMAYQRQQGVDTSISRIFNSVLADEQVLYDDGRELRRETAEQAARHFAGHALAARYEPRSRGGTTALLDPAAPAVEHPLEGVTVPSFSAGGRIEAATASALIAHPTSQRCFEVGTRYGRSIRVTGDHSLFVEGADGEPEPMPVDDLEVGDRVAIAGRIEVPERDRAEVSMLDVWRHLERDPWDLAVEAPGLGSLAWERRRNVAVPATIAITDDFLWFLGLFVAEGCLHESAGNALMTLSGEESLLRRAADIVERTLGLHVVWSGSSPGRSAAITVHSKLLLRLMDHLGFDENRKRIPGWILGLPLRRLKWFLEGYREGDGVHSGAKLAAGVRHEFSTVYDELKDDLVVALGRFGLVPSVGLYHSRLRARTGERRYPFWRLTLSNVSPWSPLEWDRGVEQELNARRTGDLVWAVVTGIEEVEATSLVYDFSVPGLENFWAGTGVMAKNTFGPRMRPNDGRAIPAFLQQALSDKPLTVFGDGSQTRSFCFVDDLIRGLVALAESGVNDPVNVGNPEEMSLLEMAKLVIELTESRSEIVFEALPVDDPKIRQPDITRARNLLGWEPEIDIPEGLRRTIAFAVDELKRPA